MTEPTDLGAIPPIGRAEVRSLAEEEYARFAELVRSVDDSQWTRSTDCDRWDVRALCLHVLGAMEAQASPRELIHQFWAGLPLNRVLPHDHWVDGINELQIRDRVGIGNAELVRAIARVAPAAVTGRRRVPPPIRWMPIPMGPPIGWKPLTYLLRMGFTRDVWMHRIDLARAIGRETLVTREHDGRIIADIVAEWGRIHRASFLLTLEGPAGGVYRAGDDGDSINMDAIDFCRVISGRGSSVDGLLSLKLPL